jgi:hypothetical protein
MRLIFKLGLGINSKLGLYPKPRKRLLIFSCGVVLVLLIIVIRLIVLESIVGLGSIHPVTVPTA